MIDIDKTLGHEAAQRAGIEAMHKTINRTPAKELAEQIKADLTFMVNQAVNAYVANPGKLGGTMGLSQLTGYMAELADLTGKLAVIAEQEGYSLAVHDPLAAPADRTAMPGPGATMHSESAKAAAAGVNL